MIFRVQVSAFLAILSSAAAAGSLRSSNDEVGMLSVTHDTLFHAWSQTHNKEYLSEEHKNEKLQVWLENHKRIEEHNNQVPKPSFLLGHNEYSDMTQDEFAQHFRLGEYSNAEFQKLQAQKALNDNAAEASARRLASVGLPDSVDWVSLGGVTPVKNQGACGSCWAFSTTGALEGAKFVKTGELVALSEQNLLDCDHKDLGCNGGLMDDAFKFDEKQGGLCSEADYPYLARQGKQCLTNCTDVPGSKVVSFVDVPPSDEMALLSAIAMQPISVAIQANQFVFQFYKKGVITDDSCGSRGSIDHGVLAVGYGTDLETQEPYFLVKNSWGGSWGEEGYVKLGRKTKNKWGMCAVLKMASFPIVDV